MKMSELYRVGQAVMKQGKPYGSVIEVNESGYLVVQLGRPRFTGSDQRDDAGIVAGTKVKQGIVSRVQIAGDPLCQVRSFEVA